MKEVSGSELIFTAYATVRRVSTLFHIIRPDAEVKTTPDRTIS